MQIWILTRTYDIDATQILGAYDHDLGTRHFADQATRMLRESRPSLFGTGEDDEPLPDPLTTATRDENGTLTLDVRGDTLTLAPFDYLPATAAPTGA